MIKACLFDLLGMQFAPRLRDLGDQQLYRMSREQQTGRLTPRFKGTIQQDFILRHWDDKQLLRSSRRNVSPVELIDGPFLMRHEHVSGTLVERREIAQTPSRANGILHYPPEAFNRVEVVPAMGG